MRDLKVEPRRSIHDGESQRSPAIKPKPNLLDNDECSAYSSEEIKSDSDIGESNKHQKLDRSGLRTRTRNANLQGVQTKSLSPKPSQLSPNLLDNDECSAYSSEEIKSDSDIGESNKHQKLDRSGLRPRTPNANLQGVQTKSLSPKPSQLSPENPESSSSGSKTSRNIRILLIFGLILLFTLAIIDTNKSAGAKEPLCSFKKLQTKFPNQDLKVWKYLNYGIESILNKKTVTPAVYLFVHEGSDHVHRLVKDIASFSSSCFGQNRGPIEMVSSDFNSDETVKDYGYAIKKFKEKIQNGNVVLIANLNEIPAPAARALHAICDTFSPIAPDVVIFLTLVVNDINQGNVEEVTEKTLKRLWEKHMPYYELDPLITRVTDQVIALRS